MRIETLTIAIDDEICYEACSYGLFVDADGNEHDSMPGVVAHDAPWAAVCVVVDGGNIGETCYKCFESINDYRVWSDQI